MYDGTPHALMMAAGDSLTDIQCLRAAGYGCSIILGHPLPAQLPYAISI